MYLCRDRKEWSELYLSLNFTIASIISSSLGLVFTLRPSTELKTESHSHFQGQTYIHQRLSIFVGLLGLPAIHLPTTTHQYKETQRNNKQPPANIFPPPRTCPLQISTAIQPVIDFPFQFPHHSLVNRLN